MHSLVVWQIKKWVTDLLRGSLRFDRPRNEQRRETTLIMYYRFKMIWVCVHGILNNPTYTTYNIKCFMANRLKLRLIYIVEFRKSQSFYIKNRTAKWAPAVDFRCNVSKPVIPRKNDLSRKRSSSNSPLKGFRVVNLYPSHHALKGFCCGFRKL